MQIESLYPQWQLHHEIRQGVLQTVGTCVRTYIPTSRVDLVFTEDNQKSRIIFKNLLESLQQSSQVKITELRFERRLKTREINLVFGIAFHLGALKEMAERLGSALGCLMCQGDKSGDRDSLCLSLIKSHLGGYRSGSQKNTRWHLATSGHIFFIVITREKSYQHLMGRG